MAQMSGQNVNTRFEDRYIDLIDEWCSHLSRKRRSIVHRSDVLRLALATMPLPKDASPELIEAHRKLAES